MFGDRDKNNDWGFGELLSLHELTNPAKGYVVDNTLRLRVQIWNCQERAYFRCARGGDARARAAAASASRLPLTQCLPPAA